MTSWNALSTELLSAAPLSAADYKAKVSDNWLANASQWSAHTSSDSFHEATFDRVIGALLRERALTAIPSLIDFGCGAGTLTREIAGQMPGTSVTGIDNCPAFATQKDGAVSFAHGDLEVFGQLAMQPAQAGVCVLTLVEIFDYQIAIANMHAALSAAAPLLAVVLDPTVEYMRFVKWKAPQPDTLAYNVDGEFAISSHFQSGQARSPRPYFRFIRPLDCYVRAALDAGFTLERAEVIETTHAASPRGILLTLRK